MMLFLQALEYLSAGKLTERTAAKVTSFLIGEVQCCCCHISFESHLHVLAQRFVLSP